jgi:hypothetical protein
MPMPIYFRVGERELNVSEDEARELVSKLPAGRLRDEISARVGVNDSSVVNLDVGGDERGNLLALSAAIESFEQDDVELSRGLASMRTAVSQALEEPPDRLRRAPPPE